MNRLAKVIGLLRLARPAETAAVCVGTLVGARLAGDADLVRVALLAGSNGLLCAGSMMVNDWRDVAADRVNKPRRPIPSGAVGRQSALAASGGAFLGAVGLAALVSSLAAGLAAAVALASVAYTLRLKSVPWLGNGLVALLTSYPLWCWLPLGTYTTAWPTHGHGATYLAILVACVLFRLGAEVVKTGEDLAGDRASGVCTVATTHGAARANWLGTLLMAAGLLLAWLPVVDGEAGLLYTVLLTLANSALLAVGGWVLLAPGQRDGGPSNSALLVNVNRLTMGLMVTACALGLGRLP